MPRRDIGLRAELSELAAMLRAYVVQETVGPLRGIGRYLLFGLLGAVGVSLSVVLGALALVRVLQTETTVFGANWSFVPHLAGAAVLIVAIVTVARAIRPKDDATRLAPDIERFDDGATERGED
ncbi:hypothetical protein [Candidatus Poriferisodalis sp.]|uniref:hypothetical protein n=1 Tax=Candidatus Poriferisodalis sp. TaxID=3101277 RepID=UPI003C6F284E